MAVKLFLDFDGTVTATDVGNAFFHRFGGDRCLELVEAYRGGQLSAQECFRGEAEAMAAFDPVVADQFLTTMEVRSGLVALLEYCRRTEIAVTVLSDGLDYYIRTILSRVNVACVPFYANSLFPPQAEGRTGAPRIEFPFANAECDRCGCCKRNIMLRLSHDRDVIVYVGDGFSDTCPVQYADIVFARGELQTFCREENISYFPYRSLDDVRVRLEELMTRRKIRPRHRAEVRRHALYTAEA
jgi:2-hydroxy-3-keto-5-methylthiopentenyl-1-phosphate phosphatase